MIYEIGDFRTLSSCDASEYSYMLCMNMIKNEYSHVDGVKIEKIGSLSYGIYDTVESEFLHKCMVNKIPRTD